MAVLGQIVLYGDPTFANRARRDAVQANLRAEASARGFTDWTMGEFGPGAVATTIGGAPALRCCWTHTDFAVVEQAHRELKAYIDGQGSVDGQFSTLNNS